MQARAGCIVDAGNSRCASIAGRAVTTAGSLANIVAVVLGSGGADKTGRPLLRPVFIRQHLRENPIHPFDQRHPRPEIHAQPQRLQQHAVDAVLLRIEEQPHLGAAKPVHRLHRVAHGK